LDGWDDLGSSANVAKATTTATKTITKYVVMKPEQQIREKRLSEKFVESII